MERRADMMALEHTKASYWIDFLVYALLVTVLASCLFAYAPEIEPAAIAKLTVAGVVTWSLIEYVMHRFVLHAIEPFKSWHALHHDRPTALIIAPTLLSATLITLLVFVPALLASSLASAISLTLGVTVGYLAYSLCHHATHHCRATGRWLRERKRWHAVHHGRGGRECYGVTSNIWDHVFGTGPIRVSRFGRVRSLRIGRSPSNSPHAGDRDHPGSSGGDA